MCKDATGLDTISLYSGMTPLFIGDGTSIRIVGIGNTTFIKSNRILHLSNICIFHNSKEFIISISVCS